MIIIKIMGGLGNQMFQYAMGYRLAQERGISLKLDISWFQTQKLRSYQLNYFRISAEIASSQEIATIKKANWGWFPAQINRCIQWCLPYYRRTVVKEKGTFFDPSIFKGFKQAYLAGYWQSEKYFKPIEASIHKEFRSRQPPSPFWLAWAERIQNYDSISLHVRRGDYVNNPQTNQVYGICPPKYYAKAISYIRQRLPETTIFVFSNDLEWARQNLDDYSPIEFVEIKNANQDQEELLLMSLCDHHIIANSSFSWWGAWLGNNPQKIVISPHKWFNDPNRDTRDLIPETWLRL